MKATRFDLEERIMRSWVTSDDIEDFLYHFSEREDRMSEDEVFNAVWGIKELHDIRMNKLLDTFKRVFELDEFSPAEAKELREQFFSVFQTGEIND